MDSGGPWWKLFEGVFRGFSTVSSSAGPEQSPGRIYGANFAKMLVVWWTNKKHSVLISFLQSTQWINSELMSTGTFLSCSSCLLFSAFHQPILHLDSEWDTKPILLAWQLSCKTYRMNLYFQRASFPKHSFILKLISFYL